MKRLIVAVLLMMGAYTASAQGYVTDSSRGVDKSRLMFGGSLGFSFGTYTFVNVSPLIGYRFSQMFAAGININAQIASEKLKVNDEVVERNNYTVFGGGVFARFYPFEQFFIHAQPEYNRIGYKQTIYDTDPWQRKTASYLAPSLLLGGGYAQPIGNNSAFTISVLYDVLQDANSPYRNRAIISTGVNLGF